jgi:hypothetical protein
MILVMILLMLLITNHCAEQMLIMMLITTLRMNDDDVPDIEHGVNSHHAHDRDCLATAKRLLLSPICPR